MSIPAVRRLTAEHVTARALVEASSFAEAAPKILQAICEAFGWEHGALWTVDQEHDVLRCVDIWTAAGRRFDEFDAISRDITFKRGVGLPGRVWSTGEPAWIPDVVRDSNFPRAAIASREGLHAAFGFPVLLHGDVLSVMEFFSVEIRTPDEELLSMLSSVGSQIGLFFARRRAQDELDRFFMLSLDMLCIAGFDGYFKRVNPAWQRVLGYTDEELLSRPYVEFIHPDDRHATTNQASKLATGEEVIYFENRYLHKDGTWRWLLWTSTPYPELQVMYAAARDITERKAAEETLAQYALDLGASHRALEDQAARLAQLVKELETARRRAEEAVEVKSAFLANMSHEIRTPLNAILGMTALALQTRLTADQRDYMATVKSSAESLLAIINDILDFSKIEAKRLDLDRAEFDVREAVGNAAKLLAVRAAEKGIELACHIAADVPEVLIGDEGRLRQVLLNVMGNAVKFTDAGEVVLRVTVETADERRATLHCSVTDTGIGIPHDKQAQIFQAFTQADSSTTRRYGGTGLGLAIALRLVELMAGRMWVASEAGRGSTFHFTAAFDLPRETVELSGAARRKALEGLRVLVVDDNATNRRILDEMLTSWRMMPTVVPDAKGALAVLRGAASGAGRFDVVISDCQMPEVDGFTLARQVKRDQALATTPVVLLTSIASPQDVVRCRKLGIDAYLTKPVKHSDLLDALMTAFGVSTRRPPSTPRPAPRRGGPLRILVVEDNLVNRKLVTRLLQKRGHRITAVDNGRAAMKAVTSPIGPQFDVVLMDVQMPEMNGLEATAAIRHHEQGEGTHVPIIALTAHAMPADRERCLAAGMDGYLAKPIDVEELIALVEASADGHEPPPAGAPVGSSAGQRLVFDEQAALAHAGGDRRLLTEVIAFFQSDSPATLRRIDRAIKRTDAEALRHAAHALKGALATVGSPAGREAAMALEQAGRSGNLRAARELYATLHQTIVALNSAFDRAGFVSPSRSRSARPSGRLASKNRRAHDQDSRRGR
ncbi:MAG TPA: response regulator [Vicinamibacterales bacterium]|nr:response regulator [Vicinamibacterales bacterium]